MANLNAGTAVRFNNGGTILIGADTLLNVMEGSLEYQINGYEAGTYRDRGVLQDPIACDEQAVTGKLSLRYTSLLDADSVLASIMGALVGTKVKNVTATGKLFTFAMTVKTPDGLGVATGDQAIFAKCYVDNLSIKTQAGTETDMIEFSFTDNELSPALTRY